MIKGGDDILTNDLSTFIAIARPAKVGEDNSNDLHADTRSHPTSTKLVELCTTAYVYTQCTGGGKKYRSGLVVKNVQT